MVETSSFNTEGIGSLYGQGAKIPNALWPRNKYRKWSNIVLNSIKTLKGWSTSEKSSKNSSSFIEESGLESWASITTIDFDILKIHWRICWTIGSFTKYHLYSALSFKYSYLLLFFLSSPSQAINCYPSSFLIFQNSFSLPFVSPYLLRFKNKTARH